MAETKETVAQPRKEGKASSKKKESYLIYDLFTWFFEIVFSIFFRTIRVRGSWRIPRKGPVILVGAPHANQFVDPVLLGIEVSKLSGRRPSFLIAESSYKHPVIGPLARCMKAIPVGRAQDAFKAATGEVYADGKDPMRLLGEGTKFTEEAANGKNISLQGSNDIAVIKEVVSDTELVLAKKFKTEECQELMKNGFAPREFKIGEKVDNTKMFHSVFQHLANGDSLGIFPEGGSHDRPEMLPLKPGVAIMALGAADLYPGTDVAIVPVGMNYFHPHKFRSRAVLEIGEPLYITPELLQEYQSSPEGKRSSVTKLMSKIVGALQLVTTNCPDFETLMVVQAGQRLYKRHRHIPLSLTIEFTRRLVQGFLGFRDKDPRMKQLYNDVKTYNEQLTTMGISDHQVPLAVRTKWQVFTRLVHNVLKLIVFSAASLPGTILGAPILIATKLYSNRQARIALAGSSVKIAAHDVIATWKILISLLMVPSVFGIYSLFDCWFIFRKTNWIPYSTWNFAVVYTCCFWGLMLLGYATIIIGEAGLDIARSIKPLYLALSPYYKDTLEEIRETRADLTEQITEVVNELGPQMFPDIADRLEKDDDENHDATLDPRIDVRGLGQTITLKGDYNLAEVPIFSAEHAPTTVKRRVKRKQS